ncbi:MULTISPECIES: hypothetical protein [Actinokineospora]|uniref:Uncharacterized protein n=1 Tax=Actinokineospora fastidiosa TaxID=1816 RepID=A0A918GI18_9PSEU|nr:MULTISPECIES: hypothetical protein [Actinokineospora]UVS80892.1 hypothetical protein Actkin_04644 [Actinokineospora sp. UTMC 2448]GGS37995.1 hypothetical protein GCM10010171_36120 [Actinokineospora fastidiosa]
MSALVSIGLVALAGILVGGAYTMWKTTKAAAVVLGVLALLAAGGAVAWYLSL